MSNRLVITAEFKQRDREDKLARILSIIRENPGIRASEISREMSIEHTWNLRSALIKRGLVRKEKEGRSGSLLRYPDVKE